MAQVVVKYCDLCQSTHGTIKVTIQHGEAQPFSADMCRDCLGKLKTAAGQGRRAFHKIKLPPQPT